MGMFADRAKKKEDELSTALGKKMSYSQPTVPTGAKQISTPNTISKGVSSGTPTFMDRVNLSNEKASRFYAQNAADMQTLPKTNNVLPAVYNKAKSIAGNVTQSDINSFQNISPVNKGGTGRSFVLPKGGTVLPSSNKTDFNMDNITYLPSSNKLPTGVLPKTKAENSSRLQDDINAYQNISVKKPSEIIHGNDLLSRLKNVGNSYADGAIGSVESIKATLKQSILNEKEYRKQLSSVDDTINNVIIARNKLNPSSQEYKKLNAALNDIYEYANSFRNRPADNTEANKWFDNTAKLQQKATEGLSRVGKELASAGISVGDNLVTLAMTGGNPAATLTAMGAKAAGSKMNELNNRGVSAADSLGRGVLSGGIEVATEKIGLDNLMDVVATGGKRLARNLLKQSLSEGGEEALSYLGNYAADKMANDPNAKFDVGELGESTLQGALSGLMFGAGGTALNSINSKYNNPVLNNSVYNGMEVLPTNYNESSTPYRGVTNGEELLKSYVNDYNGKINKVGTSGKSQNVSPVQQVNSDATTPLLQMPNLYKGNEAPVFEKLPLKGTGDLILDMKMENQLKKFKEPSMSISLGDATKKNVIKNTPTKFDAKSLTNTIPLERNSQYRGNADSKFGESVQNQNLFDDNFKNAALNNDNINTYDSTTNEAELKSAAKRLGEGGSKETMRWRGADVKNADAVDVAEGFILMKQYQDAGDYDSMLTVAEKLREIGTSSGQSVQAFSIMKRLTPEGMVYYAKNELKKAWNVMEESQTVQWLKKYEGEVDLNKDDVEYITERMNKVQDMPDGREKEILLGEVQARIQNKIPPTTGDSIKALARISMLFNPKTQIRNVLGNITVMPQAIASDAVGSIIDRIIARKTGVRTSGGFKASAFGRLPKGIGESFQDYKLGINTRDINANKFDIQRGKSFNDKHLAGKLFNKVDALNSFLLDAGDRGFYKMWYDSSLKTQMKANKIAVPTEDMKNIAAMDALERTWQDTNSYTKLMFNFKNILNKANVKGYGMGDVIMPFVKTPANLVKAVVDYSPVGVVNALANDARQLNVAIYRNQNVAVAQKRFVSNLSKGIVGSLLMALWGVLADKGIITGEKDSDKDLGNFEKNIMGIQPYSVNVNGKTYSYEWAQPVGGSMAAMADGMTAFKEADSTGKGTANAIIQGIRASGKTLFNLAVTDGLTRFMSQGDIVNGAVEVLLNEPSKFIWSGLRQGAQYGDDVRRRSYAYNDPAQTMINSVKGSLPKYRKELEPVVDTLGREVESNNSFFDTFINPSNYYKDRSNEAANEIYRLYKATGDKTVVPPVAPYYIDYKNEKTILTPPQSTKYQKTTGSIINDSIEDLLQSSYYANMSDADKVEVYNDIYAYAKDVAKNEIISNYGISNTTKEAMEAEKAGLSAADYYFYKYSLNSLEDGKAGNEEKIAYLENDNSLSINEKNTLGKLLLDQFTHIPNKNVDIDFNSHENTVLSQMSPSANKRWKLFKAKGVSIDDYRKMYSAATSGSNKKEKIANIQKLGYSYSQATTIYNLANKKIK